MTHYQGEDIEFQIRLKSSNQNELQNLSQVKRMVAYFYTHASRIAKFSTDPADGYQNLPKGGDNKSVTACLKSADTKLMSGPLYLDLYIKPTNGDIEQIRRVPTGITIETTPIKEETT